MIRAALLLALVACGPKAPSQPAAEATPDPLAARPEITPAAAFNPDVPETAQLSNGSPLRWLTRDGLPLVSLRVLIPGGSASDPAGKEGVTALADSVLTLGAGDLERTAFATELENDAIDLSVSTGGEWTEVHLDTTVDQLDRGLELLAMAISSPRFDSSAVEQTKAQVITGLQLAAEEPRSMVWTAADNAWYGDSPLAHPVEGTVASLEKLSAKDTKASWTARLENGMYFAGAGAIALPDLTKKLEAHFGTMAKPAELAEYPVPSPASQQIFVELPGASQSTIAIMLPGPKLSDSSVAPLRAGSIVLGGTFTSRLNRLLREEKGYTYGARASLSAGTRSGRLILSTSVRSDTTVESFDLLNQELQRMAEGIDDAELTKAKGAVRTSSISSLNTVNSVANRVASSMMRGEPADELSQMLSANRALTLDEVNQALTGWAAPSTVVSVVVGDPSYREQLPGEWTTVTVTP